MSTDLIPFDFHGSKVRVVTIDGEPRFVAVDVCMVLGLNNPRSSLALLDADEKDVHVVDTPGGPQQMTVVDESGLYSLVLRSRKPEAREFKRWITREVLPAIRRTGSYGTVRELSRRELAEYWAKAEAELEAAKEWVAELAPAANSWNHLADASGDYSMREAAQILDRDPSIRTGQNRLSKTLKNLGWTDHSGQPYQRHVDNGRLAVRTRPYTHPTTGEEMLTTQLRITAKGLHALHKELGGTGPLLVGVAS